MIPDTAARLRACEPDGKRPQLMHHRSESLLFVHWRGAPERIWFYSLNCNQPLAVIGTRALTGLQYFNAEVNADVAEFINSSCRRAQPCLPGGTDLWN